MNQERIREIDEEIGRIKGCLEQIGPMRPGTLTRQYKDPAARNGGYWQVSYSHRGRSRTNYVRKECIEGVRSEIEQYKMFRESIDRWVALSVERSNLALGIGRARRRSGRERTGR